MDPGFPQMYLKIFKTGIITASQTYKECRWWVINVLVLFTLRLSSLSTRHAAIVYVSSVCSAVHRLHHLPTAAPPCEGKILPSVWKRNITNYSFLVKLASPKNKNFNSSRCVLRCKRSVYQGSLFLQC